jgi:hypothetical protein
MVRKKRRQTQGFTASSSTADQRQHPQQSRRIPPFTDAAFLERPRSCGGPRRPSPKGRGGGMPRRSGVSTGPVMMGAIHAKNPEDDCDDSQAWSCVCRRLRRRAMVCFMGRYCSGCHGMRAIDVTAFYTRPGAALQRKSHEPRLRAHGENSPRECSFRQRLVRRSPAKRVRGCSKSNRRLATASRARAAGSRNSAPDIPGSSDWFDCGFGLCIRTRPRFCDLGVAEKLIESAGARQR